MIICVYEEFIQQIFYVPLNFRKGLKARNKEEIMNPLILIHKLFANGSGMSDIYLFDLSKLYYTQVKKVQGRR